jgi:hypothetical protein
MERQKILNGHKLKIYVYKFGTSVSKFQQLTAVFMTVNRKEQIELEAVRRTRTTKVCAQNCAQNARLCSVTCLRIMTVDGN